VPGLQALTSAKMERLSSNKSEEDKTALKTNKSSVGLARRKSSTVGDDVSVHVTCKFR
jgi:hypothetical protein